MVPIIMKLILGDNDPMCKQLFIGDHIFPGVWQYMMPREFVDIRFPSERRSTCMNCPKSCYEDYRPDYRCCTYNPRVPNFLLGFALESKNGPIIESLINKGALIPEGMVNTPKQWTDYLDDIEHDRFGSSDQTLCPMLNPENGYCNIHAFRNSVCSTFFCLKDHGSRGDQFWSDVQVLGLQVETALSQWALDYIGFDLSSYINRFDSLSENIPAVSASNRFWSKSALKALWADWYGREVDLFKKCAVAISDHRDVLWEIANSFEIVEADKFDQAMVKSVPKDLQDQVDPDDYETGDPVSPLELWHRCQKSLDKVWMLPDAKLELSPRVKIVQNSSEDQESIDKSDKPWIVNLLVRKGGKKVDFRLFMSDTEIIFLRLFEQKRVIDWRLLSQEASRSMEDVRGFISELIGHKILIKVRKV